MRLFDAPPGEPPSAADVAAPALRSLGPWLRMLWDVAPALLHVAVPAAGVPPAPWLSRAGLHLAPPRALAPDACAQWLRAAAAHASAHLVFSRSVFRREGVAPIAWALTGALEDARAEALAARELPGLARLWAAQHRATPQDGDDFESLLARLARALADADYTDPHPWVQKGRSLFWHDRAQQVLAVPDGRRMLALAARLGHDIGQMRMGFNVRTFRQQPDYRDDNRWLWDAAQQPLASAAMPAPVAAVPGKGHVEPLPPLQALHWRYPEWDRRAGVMRRDWCTVTDSMVAAAAVDGNPPSWASPATAQVQGLARALTRAARDTRAWQAQASPGDTLDLREAVVVRLQQRAGLLNHDARPYRRARTVPRRMAALLLVDASASSGAAAADAGAPALERQCAQAALLAQAMLQAGWRVSVRAFRSDGRHRVQVHRILDFDAPWDAAVVARLDGLRAGLSTRLGAVLRHATRLLVTEPAQARWVVVLGDGEPHDIDVHDDALLVADAQSALRSASRRSVQVACLQPGAGEGVSARAVFGRSRSACAGPAGGDWMRAVARLLQR